MRSGNNINSDNLQDSSRVQQVPHQPDIHCKDEISVKTEVQIKHTDITETNLSVNNITEHANGQKRDCNPGEMRIIGDNRTDEASSFKLQSFSKPLNEPRDVEITGRKILFGIFEVVDVTESVYNMTENKKCELIRLMLEGAALSYFESKINAKYITYTDPIVQLKA